MKMKYEQTIFLFEQLPLAIKLSFDSFFEQKINVITVFISLGTNFVETFTNVVRKQRSLAFLTLCLGRFIAGSQTTGERTGLATGTSLYKKHVLKNLLVYVILSKTT